MSTKDGLSIKDRVSHSVSVQNEDLKENDVHLSRLQMATVTATIGTVETTVAHTLGVVPAIIVKEPLENVGSIWQSTASTSTNSYFTAATAGSVKFHFFA